MVGVILLDVLCGDFTPPHAKFHDGQSITLGAALGVLTLYYTWRSPRSQLATTTAALFGGLFFLTGLTGIMYPGAAGMDPEFGEGFPQLWIFGHLLMLTTLGWWLETRRLAKLGIK
ncbi:MAG: hypothetical protein Q9159_004910 [Coniocarpon cinnabarinum]